MSERDVLPIPDQPYAVPLFEDAKDPEATFPPIEPPRPPAGAPNVLIVLIDDAGFGSSSAFGGACHAPTAERLAPRGLLAETLKLNGYSTAQIGKCHEVPVWETSPLGPFDSWPSGEGRVEGIVPLIFSADETCDVGSDTASPVSDDSTSAGSRFTGTVEWVQIDLAEAAEDLDHLITPEERLHIAMARQ